MSGEFAPPPLPPQGNASAGAGAGADAPPPSAPASPGRSRFPLWVRVAMIVAAVAILGGLAWSLGLMVADAQADPADPDTTGDLHPQQVVAGMCLEDVGPDGAVSDASVVDCHDAHRGEVLITVPVPLEVYPGDDDLAAQAREACASRADAAGVTDWVAWIPSRESWTRGDRTVTCIAVSDEPTHGSVVPPDSDDPGQDVGPDA